MHLSPEPPVNHHTIPSEVYSLGMGAIGLPGDLSSASRFVRVAFTKMHSTTHETENENLTQFFHILGSVYQTKGLNRLENGLPEYTRYSSCCNTNKGIYYYTTYHNPTIRAVNLYNENLDTEELVSYPMDNPVEIQYQN
jgi:choloylglycine hydrolase